LAETLFSRKIRYAVAHEGFNIRAIYFLAYASGAAWYPLFNVYLKEVGLTGIQIGIIASLLPVMMFVAQPFWGMVADRWGRHRVMLLTFLLSALVIFGFLWCRGFLIFFIYTSVFALFFNPVAPLIDSSALDHIEKRPKLTFGRLRLWGAIGWIVGAPIVAWIITGREMNLIFPIAALLLFMAWLIGLSARSDKKDRSGLEVSWTNLGPVIRHKQLLLFLTIAFFMAVGATSIWTFYGVYLDELGASRQLIGFAFSFQGISELPFYLVASAIIAKLGIQRSLIITFFVSTIRVFLYSLISNPVLAVPVEITHGLSYSLFIVAAVEYVNRLVPASWRATGQSLFWAAYFGAGHIAGNNLAGYLLDHFKSQGMYRVCGWLMLAVSIIALFVLRHEEDTGSRAAAS
jgi:PPP family 3-phenylpropionic acid transporter